MKYDRVSLIYILYSILMQMLTYILYMDVIIEV